MKTSIRLILVVAVFLLLCVSAFADKGKYSTAPKNNKGKKWRIGYYEGGPYQNYPMVLKSIINGLVELKWIKPLTVPKFQDPDDSRIMWEWLASQAQSRYIVFVKDAYWSSNWDDSLLAEAKKNVISRLKNDRDIDLMIAMGTKAGQDLANKEHSVPTLVCSSTDPLGAGIVKSVGDSGYNHVHARLDPTLHQRQIQLFHNIIGFKTLGVAYENTVAGRSYAAIEDIEKVAKERKFKVLRCYTKDDIPDLKEAESSVVKCYEALADKADAIFVTIQRGVNPGNMKKLLRPIIKNKVPTFSQGGSSEVKHGVLFSIAQSEFKYVGKFHAETMVKVFNGARPRDITQVFEDPSKIAINLETAVKISYDPPIDILVAADEMYIETND